jgi:peptidoglycan/xylan/chitin deacetylase (PgdA/CDA1 family)
VGAIAMILGGHLLWYGVLVPVANTSEFFGIRHVATGEKVVALTYDDGPLWPYTDQVLALLEREQVSATFFTIGRQAERYPDLVRRTLAAGHQVANHSYHHIPLVFQPPGRIDQEILNTDVLLTELGTPNPIAVRPPWGKRFLGLPLLLRRLHKPLIMWDVDSQDYAAGQSVVTIAQRVLAQVQPGSIVLFHDGGGDRARTVAASAQVIATLRDRGYRFVTIDQLLHLRRSSR